MTRGLLATAILSIGLLAAEKADAIPITFTFGGTVGSVDASLSGTFSVGQTLSGSYTFESTTLDADPLDPAFASYAAVTALSFTIGSYAGTLGAPPISREIAVANNMGGVDFYDVTAQPASGSSVGGDPPDTFALRLFDATGSAFSSDALPLTPPDLTKFTSTTWFLQFQSGDQVAGPLTSLTQAAAPVPEPSSLLLLSSALAGLGLWGRMTRGRPLV